MKLCIFLILSLPFVVFAELSFSENNGKIILSGNCTELTEQMRPLIGYRKLWDGTKIDLPAIERTAEVCKADISESLPRQMVQMNQNLWKDGIGGFGNCHGSTMYFSKFTSILGHQDNIETPLPNCKRVDYADIKAGDFGLIYSSRETLYHSFTVLTKDVMFSKNGHHGTNKPYGFVSLNDLADEYYTFKDSDENNAPVNEYKYNLERGMDCLRGSRAAIDKCFDEQQVFTVYMRCQPTDQLEAANVGELQKTNYSNLKKSAYQVAERLVGSKSFFLKPNLSDLNELKRIKNEISSALKATSSGSAMEDLLRRLDNLVLNMLDMLDTESEVRKGIFKK